MVTGGKSAKTSLRTQVRAFVVNDPIQMLLGVYPYFIWIMPIVKPYIYIFQGQSTSSQQN